MKTALELQVPKPCHENWDAMTAADKGRFCASCSKQVIDFSLMSDTEIIRYFTREKGNTCGRFSNDQLNRVLEEARPVRKKNWQWLLAALLGFISFNRIGAQQAQKCGPAAGKSISPGKRPSPAEDDRFRNLVVGKVSMPASGIIKGKVTDDRGIPIASASVIVDKSTQTGTTTGADGTFSCTIADPARSYTLTVSSLGYATQQKTIAAWQDNGEIRISLQAEMLGEVVLMPAKPRKIKVEGSVVDEKDKPVPFATIYAGNKPMAVSRDDGSFGFLANAGRSAVQIKVESPGFEPEDTTITTEEDELVLKVTMKDKPIIESEIVTVGMIRPVRRCKPELPQTSIPRKPVTYTALLPATQTGHDAVPLQARVFPNPVSANRLVQLRLEAPGSYQAQLIDERGVSLLVAKLPAISRQQQVPLQLPSNLPAGLYLLQLVNVQTRQAVTEKLLVQ